MTTINTKILSWLKRHASIRILLVLVLVGLCALELKSVASVLRDTYQNGNSYLQYRHGHRPHPQKDLAPSDIQSWMTFGYINFVFELPTDYLKTAADISDPRYPNIQIARYARMHTVDVNEILANVKQAVALYTHY